MWGTLPATDKKIGGVAEVKDGDGVGEAIRSAQICRLLKRSEVEASLQGTLQPQSRGCVGPTLGAPPPQPRPGHPSLLPGIPYTSGFSGCFFNMGAFQKSSVSFMNELHL